ncbi:uncharacterized protein TRIADDRAFT_57075 [Trichoplax adhaerens]|uniref:EF-hand domain-containing protein n=1 Tax=Trichoplax adhaerens TaxID=10228 RepID=B3S0J7_TRIAD|nr:hypothetical protein TRIADDRAFT_57075 [Trichoplax adhaerens]EDV23655.1 hypothetical protein TRIADDRAFT_57075 [Trichoplax adhaerens]|eukprot:XP_002113181.1 hypothetical protein TRIADDRAFT_57075 [Trichoplax adhaerens]
MSSTTIHDQMIRNRRENLYGINRKLEQNGIKTLLREDHVFLQGEYSGDQPDILWTSETANAYFKQRAVENTTSDERKRISKKLVATTHFKLGSDYDAYKQQSLNKDDFQAKAYSKLQPLRQEMSKSHINELTGQYATEKNFGKSVYSENYTQDEAWQKWKNDSSNISKDTTKEETRELIKNLRSTHFSLGSDPSVRFETQSKNDYVKLPFVAHQTPVGSKTLLKSGQSHVFRDGDYNRDHNLATKRSTMTRDFRHNESKSSNATASALSGKLDPRDFSFKHQLNSADIYGSGFLPIATLKEICKKMNLQLSDNEFASIITMCDVNGDGSIDHQQFANYVRNVLNRRDDEVLVKKIKSGYIGHQEGDRSKNFHEIHKMNIAHNITFGSTDAGMDSTYFKDFAVDHKIARNKAFKAPTDSQFMHIDEHEYLSSQHQLEFVNHASKITPEAKAQQAKEIENVRSKHVAQNIKLSCNDDIAKEDRIQSVSQATFKGYDGTHKRSPADLLSSKYNTFKEDGFDYLPPSEAQQAYVPPIGDISQRIALLKEERANQKVMKGNAIGTHFILGSDPSGRISEHDENYNYTWEDMKNVKAAGVIDKAVAPPFTHLNYSDNVEIRDETELDEATLLKNQLVDEARVKYLNPRDPLNMNIRRAFLEYDVDGSGTIDRSELQQVCKKLNLVINEELLDRLMSEYDTNGDGQIDYSEFTRYLIKEKVPLGIKKTILKSVQQDDFKPLDQRSWTEAQIRNFESKKKEELIPLMDSHFYAGSYEEPVESITKTDFVRPEYMQDKTVYRSN